MANNLPTVSSPLPRDLQQFVQRVREALDGGGVDGVLTARKLIATGIVTGTSTGDITPSPSVNSVIRTIESARPPTNLSVSAAHASIIVSWNAPAYIGHAYTEIWAHTSDVIGDAVLVGMTSGNNFSHVIGGSGTRYYWARNINQNGEASAFNKTAGTQGTTSTSPNFLMELLAETYGTNSQSPFFQLDSATTINDVSVPAGTYMKSAFIHNASITNAKIKDLTADKITASLLNTVDFYGNKIAGSDLFLGGTINYTTDSSGNNIGISSVFNPKISILGTGASAAFDVNVFKIRTTATAASFTITIGGVGQAANPQNTDDWKNIPVGTQITFFDDDNNPVTVETRYANDYKRPHQLSLHTSEQSETSSYVGPVHYNGNPFVNHAFRVIVDPRVSTHNSPASVQSIVGQTITFRANNYHVINEPNDNENQDNPSNPYDNFATTLPVARGEYILKCAGVLDQSTDSNIVPNHYPPGVTGYGQPTGTVSSGMTGGTISVKVVSGGGYYGQNVFAFENTSGTAYVNNPEYFPMIRGKTYTFNQNDPSNDGHPLIFTKGRRTTGFNSQTKTRRLETGVYYYLNGSIATYSQWSNATTFNAGRSSGDRKVVFTVGEHAPLGGSGFWSHTNSNMAYTYLGYQYRCAIHYGSGSFDSSSEMNFRRDGNNNPIGPPVSGHMGNTIQVYNIYPYYVYTNPNDSEAAQLVYTTDNMTAALNGIPGFTASRETLTLSESTSRIAAFVIRVSRNTTNGLEQGATGEYTPNNSYSDFAVPQASSAEGNNYLTVTNSDTTNFNVTNIRTVTRFLHPEERLPSDGSYLNQFPAISGMKKQL